MIFYSQTAPKELIQQTAPSHIEIIKSRVLYPCSSPLYQQLPSILQKFALAHVHDILYYESVIFTNSLFSQLDPHTTLRRKILLHGRSLLCIDISPNYRLLYTVTHTNPMQQNRLPYATFAHQLSSIHNISIPLSFLKIIKFLLFRSKLL